MDCRGCRRQHLKSVNNYTAFGTGGKLAAAINSLDDHEHLASLWRNQLLRYSLLCSPTLLGN